MSVHRASSTRDSNRTPQQRPFSTNNPFRNASLDSNINSVNNINQQNFQNWVQQNSSQLSFSEDDEDDLIQMPPPISARPANERSGSYSSTGSSIHSSTRMHPQRRASNNPFQQDLSAESTGNSHSNGLPNYPAGTTDNSYYTSSTEKQRLRERERELERQVQHEELPPSYEEAAGPDAKNRERPREKERSGQSSESRSRSSTNEQSRKEHRSHRSSRPAGEHRGEARTDRERRHREHREHREHRGSREHRDKDKEKREHKSSRSKHRSSTDKKQAGEKPPKNVDTIDKLDVTGLFGGAFHHDGPFDACTPHRNKNSKAAPVLAFPADGPNSSIRGSAHKNFKEHTINYINGFNDDDDLYTTSVSRPVASKFQRNDSQDTIAAIKASQNIINFDTNVKADPVHGETTLGLGSSTFLDGAPAAAKAATEDAQNRANELGRKKSLRQRLTGSNDPPKIVNQQFNKSDEDLNEDKPIKFAANEKDGATPGGNSLLKRVRSLKVGRK